MAQASVRILVSLICERCGILLMRRRICLPFLRSLWATMVSWLTYERCWHSTATALDIVYHPSYTLQSIGLSSPTTHCTVSSSLTASITFTSFLSRSMITLRFRFRTMSLMRVSVQSMPHICDLCAMLQLRSSLDWTRYWSSPSCTNPSMMILGEWCQQCTDTCLYLDHNPLSWSASVRGAHPHNTSVLHMSLLSSLSRSPGGRLIPGIHIEKTWRNNAARAWASLPYTFNCLPVCLYLHICWFCFFLA